MKVSKEMTGYGHWRISMEIDNEKYSCITTNSSAIDAAFDPYYDDEDNSGRFYKNRQEAIDALMNEIKRKNYID